MAGIQHPGYNPPVHPDPPAAGPLARESEPAPLPEEAPELASRLLDLRDKPPEPLSPSPQALGVWELAWPTILSLLIHTLVRWVDFAMVGSLGPEALAAVGIGGQFYWLVQSVGSVMPTGIVALLARAVGARDLRLADAALRQGLWLSIAVGVVATAALLPLTEQAIAIYGVESQVVAWGSDYLYWLLWGNVPLALALVFGSAIRAAGDARTPLWIGVIANAVNVLLNWVLIFGNLGAPAMGVSGAGMASSLAIAFEVAIFVWLWLRGTTPLRRAGATARPQWSVMRRIVRIGYPAAFEGVLFQVGLLLFMRLMGPYGTAAVAAYNVGAQILQVAFLPGVGFATAASTLVGQHLGEGEPERAARSGWRSLWGAVVTMSLLGVCVIAVGEQIAALFTDDAETIRLTGDFIWLLGAVQPLMAVEFAVGGALRGAGDTRFPLLAIFVGLFGCRLVLASIAALWLHTSVQIVWSALIFDYAMKAALLLWRFRRGHWRTIEV